MRVAELIAPRQFRLAGAETPPPGAGEVQVRVQAVGVCGSDMHAYAEGGIGAARCVYPMVLGHEPAGLVVKTGAGVSGWQAGDAVACEPALYCYHCEHCMAGRHNVCANLRFLSSPGDPGFFREYVNLPARNLLALPAHIGVKEGTLIEPLAVALHSLKFAVLKPGDTAAVLGAGPIGLLTIAVLKLSGTGRILAVDPLPARRELARALGASAAIDPSSVQEQSLYDVVFDCAAKAGTVRQAIQLARAGGRVVITGIPSELETPIEFHTWRRKELALFQVRRSNQEGPLARDLLAAHSKLFAPLITHTHPLEHIDRGFAQLEAYADGVGKLVIEI